MSGQREQREGLDQSSQPEPLDATLIMARPSASSAERADREGGHSHGAAEAERPRSPSPGSAGHLSERPGPARQHNSRSVFDPIPAADRRQGAMDSALAGD